MSANPTPIRVVFLGSGAFGIPTLQRLNDFPFETSNVLVVSQPARPAGRERTLKHTPLAQHATRIGLPCVTFENVNDPASIRAIHALQPDVFVVIAFGQKLSPSLLEGVFAINLHGSLLPRYRGAAPVQRALMSGDRRTGATVIGLAQRMDAGLVYASAETEIRVDEDASQLHDRLALLGPELVIDVLRRWRAGRLAGQTQDESQATRAPKLRKEEGTTDFARPAHLVRAHIHGLNPWPGCAVRTQSGEIVKIGLVREYAEPVSAGVPGEVLESDRIACASGTVEVLRIQAPGGKMMDFAAFRNGRPGLLVPGSRLHPILPDDLSKVSGLPA